MAHKITYQGKTQSLKTWAKDLGLDYGTIFSRFHRGWELKDVFAIPVTPKTDTIPLNGTAISFADAIKLLGISHQALYKSAKRRNLSPAEEIQRRFSLQPDLLSAQNEEK
mgnify:CR=1 FL=1